MKKYKAIIFDIDGTLLDTSEGILSSVDFVINTMNLTKINSVTKQSFIGPMIHNSFRNVYHLPEDKVYQAANLFRKHYSEVDLDKAIPYENISELLSYLKEHHYRLGVATYKRQDYAEHILKIFDIAKYFDYIVGSDFAGKLTKQEIIDTCVANIGVDKEKVLMIGDTDNDKLGAEKAGVDFLAVTYGYGFKPKDNLYCAKADTVTAIKNFIE